MKKTARSRTVFVVDLPGIREVGTYRMLAQIVDLSPDAAVYVDGRLVLMPDLVDIALDIAERGSCRLTLGEEISGNFLP